MEPAGATGGQGRAGGFRPLTPRRQPDRATIDAAGLERALRRRVAGEIRFDPGSRAAYSTDASNYRLVPLGVVVPRTADDVVETVAACRRFGVPLTSRGGGTSLAGQTCGAGVILDFSRYLTSIVELDPAARYARVEPGIVLDDLRAAAEVHRLTFGPDPATHDRCTLGGMIGNNSCGVHSVMAGKTADNVEELEVLTYDGLRLRVGATSEEELAAIAAGGGRRGEIYAGLARLRDRWSAEIRARYPAIPRRVSGYNLDQLLPENGFHVARALVGSEGTLVTVLEAKLRLVESPPHRALAVLGYPDIADAGDQVPEILGYGPIGLEGLDDTLVGFMRAKGLHTGDVDLLGEGSAWLLVEFGGASREEAAERASRLAAALAVRRGAVQARTITDPREIRRVWRVREAGLGAAARVPGHPPYLAGWEDAAVPPDRVGAYLRDYRRLLGRYGYRSALYGHFGDGCIHGRVDFDLGSREGVTRFRGFLDEAADLVVSHGGSLSGEHGDGQARAALLPRMFGPGLVAAFGEFKRLWDPQGGMNPGKVVDAFAPDENLRVGPEHRPWAPTTRFPFAADGGSFATAADRCVGVGACRRTAGGTMCPSYRATGDEEHSTRGRARLLFEMLSGEVLTGGWRDPHVRAALDLCLACKACRRECPVGVDMATYKAEFLSHFYRRRLRPRAAYAMGLIPWWARAASRAPRWVNFATSTRPLSTLVRALGGIAPERRIPRFADRPFTAWFRGRSGAPANGAAAVTGGGRRVLLWPDTFTNYLNPEIAQAAVEVLEAAGYRVEIPPRPLCCGRPLYDWGMLGLATRLWRRTLATLAPAIRDGVPLIGLEPSCVAAFRDELPALLPDHQGARSLSAQTHLLGDFLAGEGYRPPVLPRRALVHGHCHHQAVMGMDGEVALLGRLGLEFELLDAGCCGMAGAFGFEAAHYELSLRCGERALLPRVRAAGDDTLIVADGFSCREQIAQATGRRALHLAELLRLAQRGDAEAGGVY